MMLPLRPPAIIALAACLVVSRPAVGKLNTASLQSASSMSSTDAQCTLPAMLTTMSRPPKRATVAATTALTSASSTALPTRAAASSPRPGRNCAVASAASAFDVADRDLGALARQEMGDGAADVRAGPEHDRHLSRESAHRAFTPAATEHDVRPKPA